MQFSCLPTYLQGKDIYLSLPKWFKLNTLSGLNVQINVIYLLFLVKCK